MNKTHYISIFFNALLVWKYAFNSFLFSSVVFHLSSYIALRSVCFPDMHRKQNLMTFTWDKLYGRLVEPHRSGFAATSGCRGWYLKGCVSGNYRRSSMSEPTRDVYG